MEALIDAKEVLARVLVGVAIEFMVVVLAVTVLAGIEVSSMWPKLGAEQQSSRWFRRCQPNSSGSMIDDAGMRCTLGPLADELRAGQALDQNHRKNAQRLARG